MLNLSEQTKELYGTYTNITTEIVFQSKTFTDTDVVEGSMSLTESVCSGEQINLRNIEKSSFKFSLFDPDRLYTTLKGQRFTVRQTIEGSQEVLPIGVYIVDDVQRSGQELEITAYDLMSLIENIDASAMLANQSFPVTPAGLIALLCTTAGITNACPASWTNSSYSIASIDAEGYTGAAMLAWLQELCACFFRFDRTGGLTMVQLSGGTVAQAYRPTDLLSESIRIADYTCEVIDQLQIITSKDRTTDIVTGSGDNVYIIQSNPLVYGMTDQTAADNIYNVLHSISYRPMTADLAEAFPWVDIGDVVQITTVDGQTATAPLLNRTLSGSKLQDASVKSAGLELRDSSMPLNEIPVDLYEGLDARISALEMGGGGLTKPIPFGTNSITVLTDNTDGLLMSGTGGAEASIPVISSGSVTGRNSIKALGNSLTAALYKAFSSVFYVVTSIMQTQNSVILRAITRDSSTGAEASTRQISVSSLNAGIEITYQTPRSVMASGSYDDQYKIQINSDGITIETFKALSSAGGTETKIVIDPTGGININDDVVLTTDGAYLSGRLFINGKRVLTEDDL